jgi:hypothetical protein
MGSKPNVLYNIGSRGGSRKVRKKLPALLQEKTWKRVLQPNASSPGHSWRLRLIYLGAQ